ncbi:MAG: hypothetical protein HY763_10585 [Planctomycetes bacterium]|nr:hypothetical protein [Planctomycetota bacterium]
MWMERLWAAAVVLSLASGTASAAIPVASVITYQGQLKENGIPANGVYDFEFQLWDSAGGGSALLPLVAKSNVDVQNGLFSVDLDFGAAVYNGQARWLEVKAKPDAAGGFTTLVPRQALNPAPYALYALNPASGGGTLDQAYDFGGPGAGRTITADSGAVNIAGAGGLTVSANIGVGTVAPQWDVHAYGSSTLVIGGQPTPTTIGAQNNFLNPFGGTNTPRWGYLAVDSDNYFIRNASADVHFATEATMNSDAVSTQMTLSSAGNLGIGTITPAVKLHVEGGSDTGPASGGFLVLGAANSGNVSFDNNEIQARNNGAASTLYINHEGGDIALAAASTGENVGIGTQNPATKLHVLTSSTATSATISNFGGGTALLISKIGGTAPALTILDTGTGISLDVAGKARVEVLEVLGADIAERFPVSDEGKPEPGTVMAIDPAHPGKLCVCEGAYNRRVAGIVSGANDLPAGAIMGHTSKDMEEAPAIALTGRVWVQCDRSGGGIEPGDLLTTSDRRGHAMKVSDYARAQGAIIGKAMTPLEGETGMVLVLVSLQ